jgi:hypothetical protein
MGNTAAFMGKSRLESEWRALSQRVKLKVMPALLAEAVWLARKTATRQGFEAQAGKSPACIAYEYWMQHARRARHKRSRGKQGTLLLHAYRTNKLRR